MKGHDESKHSKSKDIDFESYFVTRIKIQLLRSSIKRRSRFFDILLDLVPIRRIYLRYHLHFNQIYCRGATTEIADFILTLGIDKYVLHLDISMRYSFLMHILKQIRHDCQNLQYDLFVKTDPLTLFQYCKDGAKYAWMYPLLHFSMKSSPYFSSLWLS